MRSIVLACLLVIGSFLSASPAVAANDCRLNSFADLNGDQIIYFDCFYGSGAYAKVTMNGAGYANSVIFNGPAPLDTINQRYKGLSGSYTVTLVATEGSQVLESISHSFTAAAVYIPPPTPQPTPKPAPPAPTPPPPPAAPAPPPAAPAPPPPSKPAPVIAPAPQPPAPSNQGISNSGNSTVGQGGQDNAVNSQNDDADETAASSSALSVQAISSVPRGAIEVDIQYMVEMRVGLRSGQSLWPHLFSEFLPRFEGHRSLAADLL